ncbi:flavin reductase (DIM6/NTAB) family NADH-FMN oxidoreductase RutF [Allocatelliglobosispora scoriae]|uniref:Flavin reductase (DIM6/NTAB) family NADH-FMN oxidoreductase RutF n=1 Tax=Allocatelliglobosispora scoriae TaxID=643052 RepID=A0A841C0H1_9ACTN|nr:flavin reductase [Allocatelliglobosispora scoriae]MBB5873356.1 flavin reductase (DIM6/NTAB) family NADH-FMN oxidoreductase RutF [Allocatelliglobosispora scoriae]
MDSTHLRSVLGQWPSGVAVVTTIAIGPGGVARPHGMTASSFSAVSLDPPLVSVCLGNHLPSRALVESSGVFTISFLGKDQAHVGRRFAGMHPEFADRFTGLDWERGPTGCLRLADATAWLECSVEHAYPGGDHTIFVGRVLDAAIPRITSPLLFHSRNWGQLADPLPDEISMTVLDGHPLPEQGVLVRDTEDVARIARMAADGAVIAYVDDAFTPAREETVLATLGALCSVPGVELGCAETGPASPLQVRRVLQDAVVRVRPAPLRVRLLAHHGLGLVNALVAMKSGVSRFDTVLDATSGGLPAHDLLLLARQLGVACPAPLPDFDPPSTRE